MKKVVLSAGHYLLDSGAVNTKEDPDLFENSLTMEIVKLCVPLLKSQGITVSTVPDDLDLIPTIAYINKNYAAYDCAIEIHINAGGGTGIEGWYYQNYVISKKLSDDILNGIVSETGMKSRGSKDETTNHWGRLGFVHDTAPLAVLIECGFIDSLEDIKVISVESGRFKIAKGIARGICQNLGITWDETKLPVDENAANSDALKQALKDLEAEKTKKLDARAQRDQIQKDFDSFKTNEYKKAVDLANLMEERYNTKSEELRRLQLQVLKPAQDELKKLKEETMPILQTNLTKATLDFKTANEKIDRLLAQKYTFSEAFRFLINSTKKGGV